MYYANTIRAIKEIIEKVNPGTIAITSKLGDGDKVPISHLLWMCNEVEKMDISSVDEAVKAGRWMGWIFAHIEMAGLWNNKRTRDLVRNDRKLGFDKPHQE